MPTKPRTKKPAAKPQRKPRKAPDPAATVEAISQSIAGKLSESLGRRLEKLLAKPDNPGFDAVAGWTVEKLGDGVAGYRANYATDTGPSRISPVDEALERLRGAIAAAEVTTDIEMEKLGAVLVPVPQNTACYGEVQQSPGHGQLARVLNAFAERIAADNRRRANLLDRLEL